MASVLMIVKVRLWILGINTFRPITGTSTRWKHWVVVFSLTGPCMRCLLKRGIIYAVEETPNPAPPLHPHCRCLIEPMPTILCGTATMDGIRGADYLIKRYGHLPSNYLTKQEAELRGWVPWKGNLRRVLPGMTIGGDVFKNRDGILPDSPGRIWYEVDINYLKGYRTRERILYSNDGLIFATYDHYKTFFEII